MELNFEFPLIFGKRSADKALKKKKNLRILTQFCQNKLVCIWKPSILCRVKKIPISPFLYIDIYDQELLMRPQGRNRLYNSWISCKWFVIINIMENINKALGAPDPYTNLVSRNALQDIETIQIAELIIGQFDCSSFLLSKLISAQQYPFQWFLLPRQHFQWSLWLLHPGQYSLKMREI